MPYMIIAKHYPPSRAVNFFLNFRDILSYAFLKRLPDGPAPKPEMYATAPTKEEATKIALEILASGQGFESVIVQDPQHPENGALQFEVVPKNWTGC